MTPTMMVDSDSTNTDNPLSLSSTSSSSLLSLQEQILQIIDKAPNRTIRPARLAAALGDLSVEDAAAELCAVLSAVGPGATFHFERVENNSSNTTTTSDPTAVRKQQQKQQQHVMVFTFPPNFQQKARRSKQVQNWKERALMVGQFLLKVLQLTTAMGLILSLLILAVMAVLIAVAALIALSRTQNGGVDHRYSNNHRLYLFHQMRRICFAFREILWCYALFGPDTISMSMPDEHSNVVSSRRDPVLREMAYDLALLSSVCCGHPGSIFYWWRMQQLAERRHRIARGWRRSFDNEDYNYYYQDSDAVEGVTLIHHKRRMSDDDRDGQDQQSLPSSLREQQEQQYRGVLSVAVEFLFGPVIDWKWQRKQVWKLRAAFLVQKSMTTSTDDYNNNNLGQSAGGVSLAEMSPYIDYPPTDAALRTRSDKRLVTTQGLTIVSHFRGTPMIQVLPNQDPSAPWPLHQNDSDRDDGDDDMIQARFIFPELVSESAIALQYDDLNFNSEQDTSSSWLSFLCQSSSLSSSPPPSSNTKMTTTVSSCSSSIIPPYYAETPRRLTHLTSSQFLACVLLGLFNWLGALWLKQAVVPGSGVLYQVVEFRTLAAALRVSLVPVLWFYANLFWALVVTRALYLILWWNRRLHIRNARRRALAQEIQ